MVKVSRKVFLISVSRWKMCFFRNMKFIVIRIIYSSISEK